MSDHGLSILIASGPDNPSEWLANITAQACAQMEPGDELIIDKNDDAPWGHMARNRMMRKAKSRNGLVFYDDDDLLEPGGLHIIRAAFRQQPTGWHIFKMVYGATALWQWPVVRCGNVSTQMVCAPQPMADALSWGDRYEGDFDFMIGLWRNFGEPVWHDEIVAIHNGQRS